MKNIIFFLSFILTFSLQAQEVVDITNLNTGNNNNKYFKDINNNYATFIGTWENATDNITFRVILWKETMVPHPLYINSYIDEIHGRFLLIENMGTVNEQIVCDSIKYFSQSDSTSNVVINGLAGGNTVMTAYLEDTCSTGGILTGGLSFKIIDNNTIPLQAEWKIKHRQLFDGESFTIPLDCIMTKIE